MTYEEKVEALNTLLGQYALLVVQGQNKALAAMVAAEGEKVREAMYELLR